MGNVVPSRCAQLLWIDCGAGAVVGVVILSASAWLSGWLGLPIELLWVMGAANLLYASYSFSLARSPSRSMGSVLLLVVANGVWPLLCIRWVLVRADTITMLGTAQLLAEAAFVGGLAVLEWRCRDELTTG